MPGPDRFSMVATLPPYGAWRRALAVDRSGPDSRPVVLAWVPPERLGDPERLVALLSQVEAAARLRHECAGQVLGSETVHDALAIVEAYRPGTSLRALLDAAGRLPVGVAARIALDACAGIAAAHALAPGEGRCLVHGAVAPTRVEIGEDGAAAVVGFGSAAGEDDPAADVRAVAAALQECLFGAVPEAPLAPPADAGVPAPLAAAIARGLSAGVAEPISATELAGAIAAAGPVASRAEVAAYVDALFPPGAGSRAERARLVAERIAAGAVEVSPDDIVEPAAPGARAASARPAPSPPPLASSPSPTATPPPIPGLSPAPVPAAGPPPVAVAAPPPVAVVTPAPAAAAAPAPAAVAVAPPARPRAAIAGATPAIPAARREPTFEPLPRPPATRPGVDPAGTFAAPARPPARSRAPLVAAAVCAALGFALGLAAQRTTRAPRPAVAAPAIPAVPDVSARGAEPAVKAAARPEPPLPAPVPASGARTKAGAPAKAGRAADNGGNGRAAPAEPPARPAVRPPRKPVKPATGTLSVAAPPDAEVFLDGRRVGRGEVRVVVPAGRHRVEVRRGQARVGEDFTVAPDETWTYDVTATP